MAATREASEGSPHMAMPNPVGSNRSITGNRDCASREAARSAAASQALPAIMRMPSSMRLNPRPSTTPSRAGRGIHSDRRLASPVAPRTSQMTAVTMPEPTTIAGVIAAPAACVAAAAPMAFMGWTGNGVRYQRPVAIITAPNPSRTPPGSIFTIAR